jgi:hypothetical protein
VARSIPPRLASASPALPVRRLRQQLGRTYGVAARRRRGRAASGHQPGRWDQLKNAIRPTSIHQWRGSSRPAAA